MIGDIVLCGCWGRWSEANESVSVRELALRVHCLMRSRCGAAASGGTLPNRIPHITLASPALACFLPHAISSYFCCNQSSGSRTCRYMIIIHAQRSPTKYSNRTRTTSASSRIHPGPFFFGDSHCLFMVRICVPWGG
jgi:hypothetical protein